MRSNRDTNDMGNNHWGAGKGPADNTSKWR
jgi:hypothetical protein